MMDYLAETVLIAFSMGAILGGVVASHLASRNRSPVIELQGESHDNRSSPMQEIRIRDSRED